MSAPLCKDCKFKQKDVFQMSECKRPTGSVDVINGYPRLVDRYCSNERLLERFLSQERCGPSGKFFEQNTSLVYKLFKLIRVV